MKIQRARRFTAIETESAAFAQKLFNVFSELLLFILFISADIHRTNTDNNSTCPVSVNEQGFVGKSIRTNYHFPEGVIILDGSAICPPTVCTASCAAAFTEP